MLARKNEPLPYISKITGIPMVNLALPVILGRTLKELGYAGGLRKEGQLTRIKTIVFSFAKLTEADIS